MDTNNKLQVNQYFQNILNSRFIDLPLTIDRNCYENAINVIVSKWSKLSQRPISIYQFGSVGAPGFSDLDFILVFPNNSKIDYTTYSIEELPLWVRQLMTHPPFFCTEDAWNELPGWFQVFSIKHLGGEELPVPKLSNEMMQGCSLGFLIDFFIVKVPIDFLTFAWLNPLPVRTLSNMLYSFNHTTRLFENAGFKLPQWIVDISSEITNFRKSWFNLDEITQKKKLASLTSETCRAAGELIYTLDSYLTNSNHLHHSLKNLTGKHNGMINFMCNWTMNEAMRIACNHYVATGYPVWYNPSSFSQILSIYCNESHDLSKYLNLLGFKYEHIQNYEKWNDGLRYHARAMEVYGNSANSLGIPNQKYVALGYYPRPPIWKKAKIKITTNLIKLKSYLTV